METVHRLMLGTTNGAKIRGVQAACDALRHEMNLPDLSQPETWTAQLDSGVDDHPLGFAMTIAGAQNRAHAAYDRLLQSMAPQEPGWRVDGRRRRERLYRCRRQPLDAVQLRCLRPVRWRPLLPGHFSRL